MGTTGAVVPTLSALRRAARAALFHRDHVEVTCVGRTVSHLPVVRLCTWLSVTHCSFEQQCEPATQVLERHGFNPGPELVSLLCRVASAKFGFVGACEDANFQRTHSRICEGNHVLSARRHC